MLSTNEPTALKVSEKTLLTMLPNDKPTFIVIPQSWSIDDRKPVLPAQGDRNGLWFGFKLFGFWLFGTCMFGFWLFWFGGVVAGFGFAGVVVAGTGAIVTGGASVTTGGVSGTSGWTGGTAGAVGASINSNKLIKKIDWNIQDSTVHEHVHIVHCVHINSIKWR